MNQARIIPIIEPLGSCFKEYLTNCLLCLWVLGLAGCSDPRFQDRTAPDMPLPQLLQAGEINVADYRGKVVYVTFWASWCAPCRLEMPFLVALHREMSAQGLEILAINQDENLAEAKAFIEPYAVTFGVVSDPDSKALQAYRVEGLPTHFLIDHRGYVRYAHMGFKEEDKRRIRDELAVLLSERS